MSRSRPICNYILGKASAKQQARERRCRKIHMKKTKRRELEFVGRGLKPRFNFRFSGERHFFPGAQLTQQRSGNHAIDVINPNVTQHTLLHVAFRGEFTASGLTRATSKGCATLNDATGTVSTAAPSRRHYRAFKVTLHRHYRLAGRSISALEMYSIIRSFSQGVIEQRSGDIARLKLFNSH